MQNGIFLKNQLYEELFISNDASIVQKSKPIIRSIWKLFYLSRLVFYYMEHTRMYLYSIDKHTPVPAIMPSLTGVSAHYLR